ncbi:MAG: zinc-binding dehydrogenase [Myxococcales bacterium]|nr:zinc-binding dehydrogenase [Myxococcales bacterium]
MITYQDIPIATYGGAETLKLREQQASETLAPDDVAISVKYSGINFAEIQMRNGFYPDAPKKPFVPGYEVSGTVERVGSAVSTFAPGDTVVAGTYFGGYASRVTVKEHQVFPLPQTTSLAEGAALPVNFFTAHLALVEMARVREGDKVLIECATGGVGTLAIQMCRFVGADVVGLTTSAHKKGYIEALGARAYTVQEFAESNDPALRGFDLIVNASGGKAIKEQMQRLDFTGRIICLGMSSGVKDGKRSLLRMGCAALATPRISVLKLFDQSVGVYALNALRVLSEERWVERLTKNLADVERMSLKPHVGKVFPAQDIGAAHEFLQTKKATGKVLLEW